MVDATVKPFEVLSFRTRLRLIKSWKTRVSMNVAKISVNVNCQSPSSSRPTRLSKLTMVAMIIT